uniref:Uncharacterized protein n=1 Tax=Rhizophagus irregularis (strain DAOM 181602 / DAOM 197198 / MUCL 43194) TaxID=747089 RepID=U9TSR2_RHIID
MLDPVTEIDFLSSFSAGLQWEPELQWELMLQQKLKLKLELVQEQEETSWMRTSKRYRSATSWMISKGNFEGLQVPGHFLNANLNSCLLESNQLEQCPNH